MYTLSGISLGRFCCLVMIGPLLLLHSLTRLLVIVDNDETQNGNVLRGEHCVGADVWQPDKPGEFRYPSYVQHIMGDIFSLGFGPFR